MQSPFEGQLVRLRAREPGDEPMLYRWFNDPEVTEHLTVRYPLSHAQERAFIESAATISYDHASFAVETITEGRLIGGVGLEKTSPESRRGTLGIALGDKQFWNGGYGTDTMRVICRFGFESMNLHRIEPRGLRQQRPGPPGLRESWFQTGGRPARSDVQVRPLRGHRADGAA